MRPNFRVKLDFSRFYQDARQHSWVFVDGANIFYIYQLANHIQKLFNIKKPFHLMARYEEVQCFLPFEEDVRVLENNDTVQILPGTGIDKNVSIKEKKQFTNQQYEVIEPGKQNDKDATVIFENSETSTIADNNSDLTSATSTFYKTAYPEENLSEIKNSKIYENTTEISNNNSMEFDNSENGLSSVNKKKRIRKRKSKNKSDNLSEKTESDMETGVDKKPKIIGVEIFQSGKHIRFQDPNEDSVINHNSSKEDKNLSQNNMQQSLYQLDKASNNKFSELLNLRQKSSTPMTFTYKRPTKNFNLENSNESKVITVVNTNSNKLNGTENTDLPQHRESNNTLGVNDTISFNILKMSENYTPIVSSVILGKVLQTNEDGSKCTLKILDGKEQLRVPNGKFSLQDDEECANNNDDDDIITLDKSSLLNLSKVGQHSHPKQN